MKRVAILLDGAFVVYRLYHLLGGNHATADDVLAFARKCLYISSEELFRVYYYDCPPHDKKLRNPVSGQYVNFKQTPTYHRKTLLQRELRLKDHVAYREGVLSVIGWSLKREAYRDLLKNPRQITESDLGPNIKQKTIDMKIGLDIAWLAGKLWTESFLSQQMRISFPL